MLQPRPGRRRAQRPFGDVLRVSAAGVTTAALVLAGAATGAAHANAPTLDRTLIVLPAADLAPVPLPATAMAAAATERVADSSGTSASGTTATVRLTVTIADVRAPHVRLHTARSRPDADGLVRLTAFADDDSAVAEVRFVSGARGLGPAVETAPGVWTLDTPADGFGADAHLAAIAVDEWGNAASTPAHRVVPPRS